MEVQIVSSKLINPSSPTPPELQSLKISAIDQLIAPVYVGTIFYYTADENGEGAATSNTDRSGRLERSLSEILTVFYPFAGRYSKENICIDCNDQGVEYVEAVVSGKVLSQVLNGEIKPEQLNRFLSYPFESPTSPLVAVQVNMFECGGLAIGLRISHRLADGLTIALFLTGWATACREGIDKVPGPSFSAASLFPPREVLLGINNVNPIQRGVKIVTETFVFDKAAISKLKDIAGSGRDDIDELKGRASRVDVVTALIWRTLIKAGEAKHGRLRPSLLAHAVDMRGKTTVTIPGNTCGNLFRLAVARFSPNESKIHLQDLAGLVRKGLANAVMDCSKAASYDEVFMSTSNSFKEVNAEANNSEVDVYMFTSWCRFPLYAVDYGWGKPAWVGGVHKPVQVMNLMDTDEEGIEAWLSLDEQDMILFRQDPDIIAHTASRKM